MITAAPVPGLEPAFTVAAQLGPLEDHGGLERSLFIASAVRGADTVSYTAYRVT